MEGQTTLANRYELSELLGSGGMGSVYLARDLLLEREVALKVLKESCSEEGLFRERFRCEARSAASLSHPNVVSVFDAGETKEGVCYIAMEPVTGGTLKERIEEGPPSSGEAVRMAAEVARALCYAHDKGIVHRDIKPQNVLLTADGTAKVADFGIAKAAGAATVTATDLILGTVRYLSPEQATGEEVGPASDLYSLGVVLYEMLTGEVPFEAESPIAIAMKHVREQARYPRQANPEVSRGLEAISLKLLSKEPGRRYASAGALLEDLLRYQRGERPAALDVAPATEDSTVTLEMGLTGQNRRTVWIAESGRARERRTPRSRRKLGGLAAGLVAAAALAVAALPAASGGEGSVGTTVRFEELRAAVYESREDGSVATITAPPTATDLEAPGEPNLARARNSTAAKPTGVGESSPDTAAPPQAPAPVPARASAATAAPPVTTAPAPSGVAASPVSPAPEPVVVQETGSRSSEPPVAPVESGTADQSVLKSMPEQPDPVSTEPPQQGVVNAPVEPAEPVEVSPGTAAAGTGSPSTGSPGAAQTEPPSAAEIQRDTREAVQSKLDGISDR